MYRTCSVCGKFFEKEKAGKSFRVVHYINQFYADIGGKELSYIVPELRDGCVGLGAEFNQIWKNEAKIVNTIVCGDAWFIENQIETEECVIEWLKEIRPDCFIVGPALKAGDYNYICNNIALAVQKRLGIPVLIGANTINLTLKLQSKVDVAEVEGFSGDTREIVTIMAEKALELMYENSEQYCSEYCYSIAHSEGEKGNATCLSHIQRKEDTEKSDVLVSANIPSVVKRTYGGEETCVSSKTNKIIIPGGSISVVKANHSSLSLNESGSLQIEMESSMTAEELAYLTGLSVPECRRFMDVNHLNGDEAFEAIDIFMQSLNDNVAVPVMIAGCMYNAGIYSKMANRLASYNTMRGGVKGYGGFVFEELHAADIAAKGGNISVLGNNGIADFIVKDASGKEILVQAKAGYKPGQIEWSKYKGQTIVVDKGNTALANEARAAGLKVQESAISKKQADVTARMQQWESRITGSKTAPLTSGMASAHSAGMGSAKLAARVGVSMKLGENIYDMVSGEKTFEDAASDVMADSVIMVGGAYLSGAALTAAGTAVGAAASALAGTTVGAAVAGAAGAAATAVGSTAVGGAVIAGAGAIATGVATAIGAIASAPLLPLAGAGAAIGFVAKWLKKK